ncbi:MAG: hypothetical protein HQK87_01585 [Nitrospinae bacterium]|nr:hypothetical protein [Nitrospinota bacterium]
MDAAMVELVRGALTGREGSLEDFVFIHPRTGKPYQHQTLDKIFGEARKALGYPEATLEVFGRHSWVTQRFDEGWSYTDISHYTLNDVATLQKFYANVTKATRRTVSKIGRMRTRVGGGVDEHSEETENWCGATKCA